MKMRTLAASGALVGLLCVGEGMRMNQEVEHPDLKNPPTKEAKTEKNPLTSSFQRGLAKVLNADELNHEDPCLETTEALWDAFKVGAGAEAEMYAREELHECQDGLSDEQLKVSLSNFHILESRTSYEVVCGGEDAKTCKILQDKVKKAMDEVAVGDWSYNDWTWSYDENGQTLDVAAFPGYQAYLSDPNNPHVDLWSIMAYQKNGKEIYSFGIACGARGELSSVIASAAYPNPEALAKEIQNLREQDTLCY